MFDNFDFAEMQKMMQARENEKRAKLLEKLEDTSYLPTRGEIIEAFGAHANELLTFCHENYIFEFWNREYIQALAEYINTRKATIKAKGEMVVLEIGAGNGKLTHYLNKFTNDDIRVMAIDSGEWGLDENIFPVEKFSHKEAIKKYQPDLVICSWMPRGIDLTPDFPSEYILIGIPDYCATREVWDRGVILENLRKLQICRTDMIGLPVPSNSVTMSFEKGG